MRPKKTTATPQPPAGGLPPDDELVDRVLAADEGIRFEVKRVGDNRKKTETVVAFANTDGGWLALGVEDAKKEKGRDRLYGIQENPESVDELRRLLRSRITPPLDPPPEFHEVGCTLRNGTPGSIVLVQVHKSIAVHSVVDDGTFVRLPKSNRQISAAEITELAMRRGSTTVVNGLVDVPFDLLDTARWREYAAARKLSDRLEGSPRIAGIGQFKYISRKVGAVAEMMQRVGLARVDHDGKLRPTRAAVLLFAEEPNGLLDSKCTIRLFHYRGDKVEHTPNTNLLRPPKTIGGPLVAQIRDAVAAIVDALATGVQVGPLGFEIVQRYPVRVIKEAITNAVLHRDYRINADIHVRLFENRIEIENPGTLPGSVTVQNLRQVGSQPRNRILVDHLREFPSPPNLDAGEGVRMMFNSMEQAHLYPPVYFTEPDVPREAVVVHLLNAERASIWDQVAAHLERHGTIGNAEVRRILRTDDPVKASRLLSSWLAQSLLVIANPEAAKQHRRYRRPGAVAQAELFSFPVGKQPGEGRK